MVNQIFLGNPPPHIKQWIIEHTGPAGHADTWVKYDGDTEWTPVSIEGTIAIVDDMGEPTGQIENPYNIVAIEIGTDVMSIGDYAFYQFTNLTSVTIPNTVTSIGGWAFNSCGLTSVMIPSNIISIGYNAFYNCTSLTSMTFLGKTMEQVQNIEDGGGFKQYPWGIEDTSIINVA